MAQIDQYAAEWASYLRSVSEADLLRTAGDYIWLAEFGPVEGRGTFSVKRDGVVNEMLARAMDEQLAAIRRALGSASNTAGHCTSLDCRKQWNERHQTGANRCLDK